MKRFRDTNYWVTYEGRVYNSNRSRFLKGCIDSYGYRVFKITIDGVQKMFKAHRMVAECFIENPNNKRTVNHKDGDKLNNYVYNLEWNTIDENNLHAKENGLLRVPNRKFSKDEILDIYSLHKSGNTKTKISQIYKCNDTTVCRIINGKTYKEYYHYA